MKWLNRNWREDAGSIDFVQVVVGLMIVGIAAVGTFQALQFGNDQMNMQMRYRRAMSEARSHVEYWQGRVHIDFDNVTVQERQGNLNMGDGGVPQTTLDFGDPTTPNDDVVAYLRHGPLLPVDLAETGVGTDYWRIRVQVTWREPDQAPNTEPHRVTFDGTMVPAAL
jgi:hypothetical protein